MLIYIVQTPIITHVDRELVIINTKECTQKHEMHNLIILLLLWDFFKYNIGAVLLENNGKGIIWYWYFLQNLNVTYFLQTCELPKKGLFSIISLTLTTDNNSDIKRRMSSFLLWCVTPLKIKHCLCHTYYYYILLTYVSLKSHVEGIVLCVAKNIFSFKK